MPGKYLVLLIIAIENSTHHSTSLVVLRVGIYHLLGLIIEFDSSGGFISHGHLLLHSSLSHHHAVLTHGRRFNSLLLVDLVLYLFEPWVVVVRVEGVCHLAVGNVHGRVATRVRILVVNIIRLHCVSLMSVTKLLLVLPCHIVNH